MTRVNFYQPTSLIDLNEMLKYLNKDEDIAIYDGDEECITVDKELIEAGLQFFYRNSKEMTAIMNKFHVEKGKIRTDIAAYDSETDGCVVFRLKDTKAIKGHYPGDPDPGRLMGFVYFN